MKTKLPAALVPPRHQIKKSSETARCSLTIAVLDSIDTGTPFSLTSAADISAHRSYFHSIPGVLS